MNMMHDLSMLLSVKTSWNEIQLESIGPASSGKQGGAKNKTCVDLDRSLN